MTTAVRRGAPQGRRVVQAGPPRVHGAQVGGRTGLGGCGQETRTTRGGIRRSSRFAVTALNQASGAFGVGLAVIAEAPASQARQVAQVKASRS